LAVRQPLARPLDVLGGNGGRALVILDADRGVGIAQRQDNGGEPALNIARHAGITQSLAPLLFAAQLPGRDPDAGAAPDAAATVVFLKRLLQRADRKSTRLNSSHVKISYAVFCLKKKNPRSS